MVSFNMLRHGLLGLFLLLVVSCQAQDHLPKRGNYVQQRRNPPGHKFRMGMLHPLVDHEDASYYGKQKGGSFKHDKRSQHEEKKTSKTKLKKKGSDMKSKGVPTLSPVNVVPTMSEPIEIPTIPQPTAFTADVDPPVGGFVSPRPTPVSPVHNYTDDEVDDDIIEGDDEIGVYSSSKSSSNRKGSKGKKGMKKKMESTSYSASKKGMKGMNGMKSSSKSASQDYTHHPTDAATSDETLEPTESPTNDTNGTETEIPVTDAPTNVTVTPMPTLGPPPNVTTVPPTNVTTVAPTNVTTVAPTNVTAAPANVTNATITP